MKIYKKGNYEAITTSHINKYEQISHAAPLFLLLTLNRVFFLRSLTLVNFTPQNFWESYTNTILM